jgi:hypothetical protein
MKYVHNYFQAITNAIKQLKDCATILLRYSVTLRPPSSDYSSNPKSGGSSFERRDRKTKNKDKREPCNHCGWNSHATVDCYRKADPFANPDASTPWHLSAIGKEFKTKGFDRLADAKRRPDNSLEIKKKSSRRGTSPARRARSPASERSNHSGDSKRSRSGSPHTKREDSQKKRKGNTNVTTCQSCATLHSLNQTIDDAYASTTHANIILQHSSPLPCTILLDTGAPQGNYISEQTAASLSSAGYEPASDSNSVTVCSGFDNTECFKCSKTFNLKLKINEFNHKNFDLVFKLAPIRKYDLIIGLPGLNSYPELYLKIMPPTIWPTIQSMLSKQTGMLSEMTREHCASSAVTIHSNNVPSDPNRKGPDDRSLVADYDPERPVKRWPFIQTETGKGASRSNEDVIFSIFLENDACLAQGQRWQPVDPHDNDSDYIIFGEDSLTWESDID